MAEAQRVKIGGFRGGSKGAAKGRTISIEVRKAQAAKHSADLAPIIDDIRAKGARSLREIAAGLNERGIPTARGGSWSAVQVWRVLGRAA